jgi:hypothetical protein
MKDKCSFYQMRIVGYTFCSLASKMPTALSEELTSMQLKENHLTFSKVILLYILMLPLLPTHSKFSSIMFQIITYMDKYIHSVGFLSIRDRSVA